VERSRIDDALKRAGLRLTPQRYDVLSYLAARKVHVTADEIFSAINRRNPRLSRATVYNTLHVLLEKGLVREVSSHGSAMRYDAQLERHHHFICEQCGRIDDLEWFDLPEGIRTEAQSAGEVRDFELIFRGICRACKS